MTVDDNESVSNNDDDDINESEIDNDGDDWWGLGLWGVVAQCLVNVRSQIRVPL